MSEAFTPQLGRIESPDERDNDFLMKSVIGVEWPKRIMRKKWTPGPVTSQIGNSCVGYSFDQFLKTTPTKTFDGPHPMNIYAWAKLHDEWDWNDNRDEGTSLRAGVQYLEYLGRIKQYLWAFDIDTIVRWILVRGPVVMGTAWHRDMSIPDAQGFIVPNGPVQGGHAYEIYGVDRVTQVAYGIQTWSEAWGPLRGHFKIKLDALDYLLHSNGECCTAVEKKLV
jgi:hypothetical protein